MGSDPIAEDFHWVSPYNYAENSPVRYVDLWGLQKAEPNWLQRAASFFGFDNPQGGFFGGNGIDQSNTKGASNRAVAGDVIETAKANYNAGLDKIDQTAKNVETGADAVEYAAIGATVMTGGEAAPGAVPVAVSAELVGNVAFGVQVGVDYLRDGKLNETGPELMVKLLFGTAGGKLEEGIEALDLSGTGAKQTEDAVKAVSNGVNKVVEDVTTDDIIGN